MSRFSSFCLGLTLLSLVGCGGGGGGGTASGGTTGTTSGPTAAVNPAPVNSPAPLATPNSTPGPTPTPATSPTPASQVWTETSAPVIPGLVSSSTILDGGQYVLYNFTSTEIVRRTSSDGQTFSSPMSTGISRVPTTARDRLKEFSVVKTKAGLYVMVYEAVDPSSVSRFFLATSNDGVTFQNVNGSGLDGAILEAQGAENGFISAPDLAELSGALYLYYVADRSKCFVATSVDNGVNWSRRGSVTVSGVSDFITDPDALSLPDGTVRLTFLHNGSAIGSSQAVILTTTGSDGLTFGPTQLVVQSQPQLLKVNPDVVERIGQAGRLLMFFAISRDGEGSFDLYRADSP